MKHKLIPIAVAVLFILAAAVAFYPLVSNALAERNRSLVRTEYAEQIEQTDEAELENILAAAREYNAILTGAFDPTQGADDYYDQLAVGDSGIMGYIEIPKIDVYLPIYHGTVADTLRSRAKTIRIGGSDTPAWLVQDRFRRLDSTHLEYVIDSLRKTTTAITNIRGYLLTALYNAAVTIDPYYAAAVRHDMS